jgi:predicted membrane protein
MESRKSKIVLYSIVAIIMLIGSLIIVSQFGWSLLAAIFLFNWANNIYLKHYDG